MGLRQLRKAPLQLTSMGEGRPQRFLAAGRMISRLLAAVLLLAAAGAPAAGTDFAASVQALDARSYGAMVEAVNRMAATGHPRAADVLTAMLERKLYVRKTDGRVVIGRRDGAAFSIIDAATGETLAPVAKSALKRLRSNNRLRRAIRIAVGGLNLMSKDPAVRISAADAVFKAPRPGQIAVLKTALGREADPEAERALARALAAAEIAHSDDAAARTAAVGVLAEYTDPEVSALLKRIAAKDGALKEPAQAALKDIERRVFFWELLGQLFTGLSLGSVLLLAAIGLAITFGVMGVINMAHGEMIMIGAYAAFVVQEAFRANFPHALDWSLAAAVPAAFAAAGAAGIAVERGIIRFLYARPLETLLATWGLSLVLQQLVRSAFGPTNREVSSPSWMSGAIELQGGVLLTHNRIWIIAFSLLVVALLALVLRKTALGLQMRAVTQNRRMASAMGIRTGRVDALTFGLGSGIAGMGGVALSQIDNVSPNLGQAYIVDSFMVVVFGGVGNLLGTLFGATTLGIVNKLLESWSGAVLAKILILVAVILFIQKRPRGLFALKGRAAEA